MEFALRPVSMAVILLISGAAGLAAQDSTAACTQPTQVVQAQVDAYNRHDLEAFVATYSPDVEVRMLPADSALVNGSAALRQAYEFLLHVPPEYAVAITQRIASGCFVIDNERVRVNGTQPAADAGVAIYQVEDHLIRRVWVLPL
jgi:hypothetical protein